MAINAIQNPADISDGYYYTLEIRVEKMTRSQLDKVLATVTELPPVSYKEFSKAPIKPEQKSSI